MSVYYFYLQIMEIAAAGFGSTTQFLDMNPDCIYAVLRHLQVDDLARVSQTCTELKAHAEEVFKREHQEHFDRIEIPVSRGDAKNALIFQQFGHLINSLKVNGPRSKEVDVLQHVANRCQQHLADLELWGVKKDFRTMADGDRQELLQLFSNLIRLKIGVLRGCDSLMEAVDWTSLEDLELNGANETSLQPFMRKYPNLKSLSLYGNDLHLEIILLNDHIQELRIGTYQHWSNVKLNSFLNLKNLTKLTMDVNFSENQLFPIAKLPKLQRLFLSVDNNQGDANSTFLRLLQHHENLLELHLHWVIDLEDDGETFEPIANPFPKLQILLAESNSRILSIVPRMKNITTLQIDLPQTAIVDLEDFREIITTTPKLERLFIKMDLMCRPGNWNEEKYENWELLTESRVSGSNLLVILSHFSIDEGAGSYLMGSTEYGSKIILMWPIRDQSGKHESKSCDARAITFEQAGMSDEIVLDLSQCCETKCEICKFTYNDM